MGSYDGAESCDIVGLFILSQMDNLNIDVGLYRDDGLGASDAPPRQLEIIKKKICAIFKKHELGITIEANKKVVDFLDITMNLDENTFKPFIKPNDTPYMSIGKATTHPLSQKTSQRL